MRSELAFVALVAIILYSGAVSAKDSDRGQPRELLYTLPEKIACCKTNCKDSKYSNCTNAHEIVVKTIHVQDATKIIIEGRGCAYAKTCGSDGTFYAIFRDDEGNRESKTARIKCRDCEDISISFDMIERRTGTLKLYLHVSDWCTSLEELTVTKQ